MAADAPLVGNPAFTAVILDTIGALVVVLDPRGRVVYWNRACQEISGYTAEELAGRPFWEVLLLPEEVADVRAAFDALCAGRFPNRHESHLVGRDGRRRLVTWSNTALRGEDGAVRYVIGTGLDITERRQAEEALRRSEQRYEELLHSLNAICWEVDPETMAYTFVSQEAERLLGYPLERWQDPRFWPEQLVHPDDRHWVVPFCHQETQAGRNHDFEYRVLTADGRTLWLRDVVTVVLEGGRPVGLKGVMVDVTSRRLAQIERDHLLRRLQDAVNARDEFLSIASHELRTPLTSMQLAVQHLLLIARNRPLHQEPERVSQALDVAERQCRQLGKLVSSLLDISRIRAGRLQLEPRETDLLAVAREAAVQLEGERAAAGSRVTIEGDEPVVGCWDPGRVLQVAINLLGNAIKYGAGRPITVRVERVDGRARLSVQDQGIGIAPNLLGVIFDRFARAVSARNYGGLGLGLYIVRSIVEAHGGAVAVESEPGAGSTFLVELPLAGPHSAPRGSTAGGTSGPASSGVGSP